MCWVCTSTQVLVLQYCSLAFVVGSRCPIGNIGTGVRRYRSHIQKEIHCPHDSSSPPVNPPLATSTRITGIHLQRVCLDGSSGNSPIGLISINNPFPGVFPPRCFYPPPFGANLHCRRSRKGKKCPSAFPWATSSREQSSLGTSITTVTW